MFKLDCFVHRQDMDRLEASVSKVRVGPGRTQLSTIMSEGERLQLNDMEMEDLIKKRKYQERKPGKSNSNIYCWKHINYNLTYKKTFFQNMHSTCLGKLWSLTPTANLTRSIRVDTLGFSSYWINLICLRNFVYPCYLCFLWMDTFRIFAEPSRMWIEEEYLTTSIAVYIEIPCIIFPVLFIQMLNHYVFTSLVL